MMRRTYDIVQENGLVLWPSYIEQTLNPGLGPTVFFQVEEEGSEPYVLCLRRSGFSGTMRCAVLRGILLDDVVSWCKGALIQTAMPELSPAEREFIMNGTTPSEWSERGMEPPSDDLEWYYEPPKTPEGAPSWWPS